MEHNHACEIREMTKPHTEQSLDPENWDEIRQLGHQMVDDMVEYLRTIRERPAWKAMPEESKHRFTQRLPYQPTDATEVYSDFLTHILPYNKGNVHPRFWAWVQGTGTPVSVFADMLAATMNANVTIGEQSAMYVDLQVVNWCREMMEYPETSSGMLVSGASMANLTALLVARNTKLENVRKQGLQPLSGPPVMYCSTESHSCIDKAAEVMGLGKAGLRKIPVGGDYRMDVVQLRSQIQQDIAAGYLPFAIVGNAGTVNTGAIDPLSELSSIAKEFGLWFHVDGAFGALARLVPDYKPVLEAISRSDSVAFDLHKWMYIPYEVGCVLIRDRQQHQMAFSNTPAYLVQHERGLASGLESLNQYGIELSRGFKALKVWMAIRHYGMEAFIAQIQKNIEQAFYLEQGVKSNPALQLMAPVTLNIVCFRYIQDGLSEEVLGAVNKEIVMRLQEEGIASPSYTMLGGKYCIRVAITNHRSKTEDFDLLLAEVMRLGKKTSNLFQ